MRSSKKIPMFSAALLLTCLALSASSGTETAAGSALPAPAADAKSHYFADSGSKVDSLVDRFLFKIRYSWSKSGEYFRLAIASLGDSAETPKRDLKSRAAVKKDELIEEGRQAVRNTADQAVRGLERKGGEIKQDLGRMGEEIKTEASRELREKTDRLIP